uniref:MHC class I-like antigen recognition-like domain-containing protein n=1 Tax=Canis lupus familiaris TaxID=9615 RepID=A0A8I3S4T9_CANLF
CMDRPYSLSFFYTGLSRPSDGFPSFQATAYLNDQDFFHYDSETGKAIPRYPWSQMEGIEDWEKESKLQKAREDIFMVTLKDIMEYYKDKEGSHTFQGMFGCELQNNKNSGAFWRYAYDGRNFIEFNKEIPAWVPQDPAALNTKKKWEAEEVYVQRAKAYLEEECPVMLQRYLEYGKTYLDRQGIHLLPTSYSSPQAEPRHGAETGGGGSPKAHSEVWGENIKMYRGIHNFLLSEVTQWRDREARGRLMGTLGFPDLHRSSLGKQIQSWSSVHH